METTTDGRFDKGFMKEFTLSCARSVVLGMGDGSMTTLTIADPEKEGIGDYLKSLPSRWTKASLISLQSGYIFRNPEGVSQGPIPGIGTGYHQNGVEYPSPYDFSIYTDYLKVEIKRYLKVKIKHYLKVKIKRYSKVKIKRYLKVKITANVRPSFYLQALQQCIPPPPGSSPEVAQH